MRLIQRMVHMIGVLFLIMLMPSVSRHAFTAASIINVATADQLQNALDTAMAGQTIQLADGSYIGGFSINGKSGDADQPIRLQGSRNAIIVGESTGGDVGLHLNKSNYWSLAGFTISNLEKGIVLDNSDYNEIDTIDIHTIGSEAVHFRNCSSHNTIRNSVISNTGVISPGVGEGVYIGSDADFWATSTCSDLIPSDRSHYNNVINNIFGPNVRSEAIDVKEGTKGGIENEIKGGIISGNRFDATGISGENFADSWVDIKGNSYTITDNIGWKGCGENLRNGFETHEKLINWGRNNIFDRNIAYLLTNGYGFAIERPNHGNIVYDTNTVYGAESVLTNIPVMPKSVANVSSASPSQSAPQATIWLPAVSKDFC